MVLIGLPASASHYRFLYLSIELKKASSKCRNHLNVLLYNSIESKHPSGKDTTIHNMTLYRIRTYDQQTGQIIILIVNLMVRLDGEMHMQLCVKFIKHKELGMTGRPSNCYQPGALLDFGTNKGPWRPYPNASALHLGGPSCPHHYRPQQGPVLKRVAG